MKKLIIILIFSSVLLPQEFQIARIQYGGGGDWYSDPSSLPNLLNYLKENTAIVNASEEIRIKLTDSNTGLNLCLAINYGSRQEIIETVQTIAKKVLSK